MSTRSATPATGRAPAGERPLPTRRAFLAGLGAVGALALAGCGARSATQVTSGAVELGLWTHDPGYVTAFQNAAASDALMRGSAFAPRIAPVSANGGDLVTRTITQAVAGNEGPDLLGIIISEFPRVMKSQMAENLFVDLGGLVTDIDDEVLRTAPYTRDGTVYALESDASISVFFYREDEFARLGIDPGMETWDEYLEAGAMAFERTGQAIGSVSNGDNTSIFNSYLQFLLQRGGSPFSETGELTIDTDESVEVLEFIRRGVDSGSLMVIGDPYGAAAASALQSGTLIATVMPSWYNLYGLQANAPDQAGRWRMRTIPRFGAGGHIASNLGGTGFAIGLDSPRAEAALDLLRRTYLTKEGQLLRYQAGGYLPTLASLYEDPDFVGIEDEFLGGQRVFDVFREAARDIPVFYQSETMQQLSAAMGAPLLDVYSGRMNAAQAIRATTEGYLQQTRQAV
ncbi:ABC transporter substrate-binding protein [Allonocardiopsis opalescens]|uniref:Multiple sugar transport system substrate-binding protein/arabinosaccharide transport system substrate-binding protein n=1 Tax=Allonocardiopsis opalescens TaxID=1144618 RepID=A0A2T0QF72_9ACTN|nr:ABC transporter substrate-binding protein [Allonocardiopsis opalescens]PRY02568.1 multiple sugar transport system substrate-binding protein/arabinosaccharide transport system substrate-binding protein [Allonocardiopsis opalescens]